MSQGRHVNEPYKPCYLRSQTSAGPDDASEKKTLESTKYREIQILCDHRSSKRKRAAALRWPRRRMNMGRLDRGHWLETYFQQSGFRRDIGTLFIIIAIGVI